MKIFDAIKTSYKGIKTAKTRSLLTMLGIVIGIASVIILMSVGTSAQALILNQVQGIGSNLIFIIPGATHGSRFSSPPSVQGVVVKTLVPQDAEIIRREQSIEHVAPEVRGQARVIYGNNDATTLYSGVDENFFTVRNFRVVQGQQFTTTDIASLNHVAILGSELAKTLFGTQNPLNKMIRVRSITLRVTGVLEKKGLGPFGIDQDSMLLIPLTVAQKQLLGIDHYNQLTIQVKDNYDTTFAKNRITADIRRSHRITNPDKDDFTVRTQEDALATLTSVTTVMTVFLTAIALISLIVGGIGIMNIMFVSVVERTKEIGLRKAVGATNGDILQQFLWESVMLTVLGGIIGITIGATFVTLIYVILSNTLSIGWTFALPTHAIFLAIGVSSVTGIVFGIYPARKASLKNPIDALRYE